MFVQYVTVAAGTQSRMVPVEQKFVSEANKFMSHFSLGYEGCCKPPGKLRILKQISQWIVPKLQDKCIFQWIFEKIVYGNSKSNIVEKACHF